MRMSSKDFLGGKKIMERKRERERATILDSMKEQDFVFTDWKLEFMYHFYTQLHRLPKK